MRKTSEKQVVRVALRPEVVEAIDAKAAERDLNRSDIIRETLNRQYRSQAR